MVPTPTIVTTQILDMPLTLVTTLVMNKTFTTVTTESSGMKLTIQK